VRLRYSPMRPVLFSKAGSLIETLQKSVLSWVLQNYWSILHAKTSPFFCSIVTDLERCDRF